jgi:adenylate cyclase
LMVLISSFYLYFRIQKRGVEAIETLQLISNGNLSARSLVKGNDEIGHLASLVNWTGSNLQEKVSELEDKVLKTELLMDELKKERNRSEKLLHNILPAAIAERLSNGEETIAEVFPEVTVLFSDIVGFTELSDKIGPSETVNMLNLLFGKFDELAEKHCVEKIKTIGDCYMIVAGVPNRDPLHCQHIAAFAIDAQNCIEAFSRESPYKVQLRIGMHTGTVAAGVVGKKRFSYDLWGDVVNVASRFETTGEPNKIHVSEAVKFRLSDDFLFLDGSEVKLKGKGIMKSFYLLGKKENMPEVLEFKKA